MELKVLGQDEARDWLRVQRLRRQLRRPRASARGDPRQGAQPPLLLGRGPSPLCPHACGGGPGLQHPVPLLQPQVRLRQRVAPRRGLGAADPGPGGEEGDGRGRQHPADDGARHRRPRRSAGQPGTHPGHLPPALGEGPGHQAVRLHQRPGPAGAGGRAVQAQHRPRHHHHQLRGPGRGRQDLSVDLLEQPPNQGAQGRGDPHRAAAEGAGDAGGQGRPGEGQLGDDPRGQRRAPQGGQSGGQGQGGLPAQRDAPDRRGRARHLLSGSWASAARPTTSFRCSRTPAPATWP